MTGIRANSSDPVLLLGHTMTLDIGEAFVVASIMDLRALPGFDKGASGIANDTQIAHHVGGAVDFKLNAEECD